MSQAERDTTFYIWEMQWHVRVPYLQTTDESYIKHFGMHTTGNAEIDKELSNQLIDTMIPISKMVDYHRRGIPIRIVKYDDVKKIYDYIEKHLSLWADNLKHGLNIGNAPIEDLIAMNDFANSIYPMARPYYTENTIGSSFMRAVDSLGYNSLHDRFKTKEEKQEEANKPVVNRNDYSSVFKNVKTGATRWT